MLLKKIAVIGGDARFAVCAELFSKKGCECAVFGLEKAENLSMATKSASVSDALSGCDALILPIPVSKDENHIFSPLSDSKINLTDILENIKGNPIIFIGQNQETIKNFNLSELDIITYTASKTFAILGSVPTAECAISTATYHSRKCCCNSKYLIVGCGNVGKRLGLLSKNMGAEVFMSARKKEDLAWIEAHGMIPLKTYGLSSENTKFDVIFNTVPHMVLREEVLKKLQGSPLIIELASKPYGADFKQKNKSRKTAFIFCYLFTSKILFCINQDLSVIASKHFINLSLIGLFSNKADNRNKYKSANHSKNAGVKRICKYKA